VTAPLRIAYLCLQATTEGQASHAHVHEVIRGLRASGHQVDLFEPRYAGGKAPGALGRFLEFARIQRRLVRTLTDYDVLYVRGHPLAYPAARAARRAGITTVQECNGPYEDFVQAWPSAKLFQGVLVAMARSQFRTADAVIAVTPHLARWLAEDTGRQQVTVVPNGANTELFAPGQPRPDDLPERYAVFFGALQPWQGIETILLAIEEPEWPDDLHVVFAGDGPLAEEVRSAQQREPERIHYLGRLPYQSVPSLVSNAVVSLIGFNTKPRTGGAGSPVKLYESMASGVPVVAGDLPGQSEVIRDARCGVLVDPITPHALASAVSSLVADPEALEQMGQRARAVAVAQHSWAARAALVGDVVQRVALRTPRIAYLSLQAVVEGQDTWAAVTEIVKGIEADGWTVDPYFPDYPEGVVPGPFARLREMSRIQSQLSKKLRGYDAIYVRAHPMAWPIARLADRRGVPVVQECNGPYEDLFIAWPRTRIARPVFEYLQRSQYRAADAVISVSQGLTDWLIADTGNERIVTNGNGANIEVFTPDAPRRPGLPERFAVFFGQFPPWQGIGTLLEAVQSDAWPAGLQLVFVGDGAMRPDIERVAARTPERVSYIGKLPYEQVASVAAHALVSYVPMVAPEREAKFSPLKLYESMACGVPVIASDTIGISEVVSETGCGILVPAGDATALTAATCKLAEDPALAQEMGRRGRVAAVERYSWRARSRQRRAVIEAAIAGRPIGAAAHA